MMEKEIVYRKLFESYAKSGEGSDQEWIDGFNDIIIENGEVVGSHS
jgi:hypothetical protein